MTAASGGGAPPTAQAIAEALACGRPGCGCGKREGKGFQTHCPAHADANPSLSIADGEDGRPGIRATEAVAYEDRQVKSADLASSGTSSLVWA